MYDPLGLAAWVAWSPYVLIIQFGLKVFQFQIGEIW